MFLVLALFDHYLNRNKRPTVISETKHFLFINKPPDMVVNSNDTNRPSVATFLLDKFPMYSNKNLTHNFYFPHRLDYSTSGILCIPKHKYACKNLCLKFAQQDVQKFYVAIVKGHLCRNYIIIRDKIGEDISSGDIQKMCIGSNKHCRNARNATTHILLLEEGIYDDYLASKILIQPFTGRRHQIRVHCSSIGHTIVGDYTYSNRKDTEPPRMFLHAMRLKASTAYEEIDVSTSDPFTSDKIKNWQTVRVLLDVNQGFKCMLGKQ